MMYLLYGQDSYRSRKKVREITDRFYAVAGSTEGELRVLLSERTRGEVEAVVETGSLFRDKRLVLLEEPSEASADVLAYLQEKIPVLVASQDVFVVWDRKPKGIGEEFIKNIETHTVKVQKFDFLSPRARGTFLDEELRLRTITIQPSVRQRILAEAGPDTWQLVQVIEKYAIGKQDTQTSFVVNSRIIFSFTDACGLRRRTEAWNLLQQLLKDGVTPERVFWALISYTRTLMRVQSMIQNGTTISELPRKAGIHPFVAKKAIYQSGRCSFAELLYLFERLVQLDFETKQGRGDMALGLERIILAF